MPFRSATKHCGRAADAVIVRRHRKRVRARRRDREQVAAARSGRSTASISRSPDSSACPPPRTCRRQLVGAVREQRGVAGRRRAAGGGCRRSPVDRDVRRRRAPLDEPTRVERDAGAGDHGAPGSRITRGREARAARGARSKATSGRGRTRRCPGGGSSSECDAEPAAEIRSCGAPSRPRRGGAAKAASQSIVISAAPASMSCEPTCTACPRSSRRAAERLERVVRREAELRAAVAGADCSCVSASTPGVTRISVRVAPASRARSTSSSESTTTSAPASAAARSSSSALLLPCTTRRSPVMPARCANRARRASRRRRRCPPRRGGVAARRSGTPSCRRRRSARARRRRRGRSRAERRLVEDERAAVRRVSARADAAERELAVADERSRGRGRASARLFPV